MLRCVMQTPLGFPVEPDVNMMYARSFGPTSQGNGSDGSVASDSEDSSRTTISAATLGICAARERRVRTMRAPASRRMPAVRSFGFRRSSGTYAPPAFQRSEKRRQSRRASDRGICRRECLRRRRAGVTGEPIDWRGDRGRSTSASRRRWVRVPRQRSRRRSRWEWPAPALRTARERNCPRG